MAEALRERLKLYLVMGTVNCLTDPLRTLEEAIEGGITAFQFREKGPEALQGQEAYILGKQLQKLCKSRDVLFIVNDDAELALRLNADGVHIGQEDQALAEVRTKMRDKIVGVSAHDVEEANLALQSGADYLGVGPMYPTATKSDIREVKGPSIIKEIRRNGISLPLVGIGGISQGKIKAVIEAGADGAAVISAITQAGSPRNAAQMMLREVSASLYWKELFPRINP